MFQMVESLKECQDAITQQLTGNTNAEQKLAELAKMLQTVITHQTRPPDGHPRGYHLQNAPGREGRRPNELNRDERRHLEHDRREEREEGRNIPQDRREDKEEGWY